MSNDDSMRLEIETRNGEPGAWMNQYAQIVLTAIGQGLTPQAAVDFATMEWAQHPEWDWSVKREWQEWGGRPEGLDVALLSLAKFIAAQG